MGGTFSTWIDKETDEYFLYIRPTLLSEDKPDRVTLFAQISPVEDPNLIQSMICDLYSNVDLIENPTQRDEQIVFHSIDQAILTDSKTSYIGVDVVNGINEVTWEKTWSLSVGDSYIGAEFSHLGYTAPVYSDLYDYSCAFFRPFV